MSVPTPESLFVQWQRGDAEAGKAMAQRFTDWYSAIIVSRLGEADGMDATRAVCGAFQAGIADIVEPQRLTPWAHQLAQQELKERAPSGRRDRGARAGTFTSSRDPHELLAQAQHAMPDDMKVLSEVYRKGEMPSDAHRVLHARHNVKRWLKHQHGLPFRVVPPQVDWDMTPLPFYECGKGMEGPEELAFERWLLNNKAACLDLLEFAQFALALREGIRPVEAPAVQAPAPAPQEEPAGFFAVDEALPASDPSYPPVSHPGPVTEPPAGPPVTRYLWVAAVALAVAAIVWALG